MTSLKKEKLHGLSKVCKIQGKWVGKENYEL